MDTYAFNGKNDFFDFFSDYDYYSRTIKHPNPRKFEIFPSNISDYCRLGGVCEKHGIDDNTYKSIRVKPRQELIDWIKDNMLMMPKDQIYFEIISFPGEDYSRLYVNYSVILGSRLIAYIRTDSIPKQFRKGN